MDTYKMLCEANGKTRSIGLVAEQAKRHYRIAGKSTFVEDKQENHQRANYDKEDDLGRVPGVRCPSKVEPKEHHNHDADNGNASSPVDGFDALGEFGLGIMHVQKKE